MKRTFLAMVFLAGSWAAFAQNDTTTTTTTTTTNMDNNSMTTPTTNNNMTSSGNYNAYGTAPSTVQMYFTRDYPTATNVTWAQAPNIWVQGTTTPMNPTNFWVATYNNAGRYSHVYYDNAGNHYLVALPVTSTWVPDDIISKVGSMYGANIYDITSLKSASGGTVYQVRVLENGQIRTEWIDDAGTKVTEYWRTEDMNNGTMNNSNMNNSSNMNTDVNTSPTTTTTDVNTTTTDMNSTNQGVIKEKTKVKGNETKHKVKNLPATNNTTNQ